MRRIVGVLMALLLAVFGYALGQSTSSVEADTYPPPIKVTSTLKDSPQNESTHDNNVVHHEGNKSVDCPSREAVGELTFPWLTSNQWTAIGTIVIALFTVALAWTSLCQWKAIKKANDVAREAADTTKHSVRAQVESTRGNLDFVRFHFDQNGMLIPVLINNGASMLVVRMFGRHTQTWIDASTTPEPAAKFDVTEEYGVPVAPGKKFKPYGSIGVQISEGGEALACFAQFVVEYDTSGIRIRHRFAWRFHGIPDVMETNKRVMDRAHDFQSQVNRQS